jgi:phage tail sheath gpL-like
MPVDFNTIPPNLRVPLFWAEFDNTQAGYLQTPQPACLLGYKLQTAPAATNTPLLVASYSQAVALFGAGSMLADMVDAYRANDPTGILYCIAVPAPTGTPASGTVTFAGTPTQSSTIAVYVAGRRYPVGIVPTSTPTGIANALAAAINADPMSLVTAAAASGVVTLTAHTAGTHGDVIDISLNLAGIAGAEWTPSGLSVTLAAMAGGTGSPDITAALASLADSEYDFVCSAWSDASELDELKAAFNDQTGRWAWNVQLYGHAFTARGGTAAALQTFGQARNDQHCSVLGFPQLAAPTATSTIGTPSPAWRIAAALTGEAAVSLRADPARPLQTLPLNGVVFAPPGSRFIVADRQALLFSGIATCTAYADGVARIERCVTTYQKDGFGNADPSYLDVQTPATLQLIVRTLRNAILSKFPRCKLADNGTRFGPGQAIVTPNIVRAELVAQYSEMEYLGIVENTPAFTNALIVERNANDPNRLDVLFPPDLVNQLRIFALLVQFRLQYPAPAATAIAA